jgi:hypothetical protein
MDGVIQELEREIQEAFASRSYPGDDRIARRQPGCQGAEAEETWERFRGKDWRQIAAVGRELDFRDDVSFLTPEGFVYYLPAFLELALDQESPTGIDDSLVFHLWSFSEEIASLLQPKEKRAVVRVLEYLAGEYDKQNLVRNNAQAALDHYWAYFTDEELGLSPHAIQK